MTSSKNASESKISQQFIVTLEHITELVQQLLEDIREGEINFATLKTELSLLIEKVKELSSMVRESEGDLSDLTTRVILIERAVAEIKILLDKSENKYKEANAADKAGKWQVIGAVTTGGLALVASIITLLMNLLRK